MLPLERQRKNVKIIRCSGVNSKMGKEKDIMTLILARTFENYPIICGIYSLQWFVMVHIQRKILRKKKIDKKEP